MPQGKKAMNALMIGIVLAMAAVLVGSVFYLASVERKSEGNVNANISANVNATPEPPPPPANGGQVGLGEHFQTRLVTLGVERVGQPIEGFDSGLLMMAFPGLRQADFHMVQSLEGHYEYKGDELVFVRDQDQPMSSAERTVSDKGYATLLANISSRLGMPVGTEQDVDRLIEAVDVGDGDLKAGIGQMVTAFGVTITPLEVLEDSRCPADVQCIWAGTVRLRAQVKAGSEDGEVVFELGKAVRRNFRDITLEKVEPSPRAEAKIDPSNYVFFFKIVRIK